MGLGDIFGGTFSGFSMGAGGIVTLIWVLVIAVGAMAICGGIIYYFWNRKQWNLKVEFKLPRSVKYLKEGQHLDANDVSGFVDSEWGKGSYNARQGIVWLKRKGKKKLAMKPFQIGRYLQGRDTLTVVQIGAEDYIPVMPESYLLYEDDKTGQQTTLLRIKADTSESRAWKEEFERKAKSTYSISSLLEKYAAAISIGLVIFLWGIQMLLLWNRIKG